jgi:DNA-directed RNA polymerase specialized sigma subunit
MNRLRLLLLLICLSVVPAWAQEAESETAEETEAAEETGAAEADASAAEEVTDEEIEELLGLDDEEYTELEDDFDPTEEVRFEQSIPFPTDI